MAVCDKTFQLLQQTPYTEMFDTIEPLEAISLEDAKPFDCRRNARRHPRETKGMDYQATTPAKDGCSDDGPCC
jgi:hypothetical protein